MNHEQLTPRAKGIRNFVSYAYETKFRLAARCERLEVATGNDGSRPILIGEVMIPMRIQTQIFEHLQILFYGLIESRQVIAHHERAGAGGKHQALEVSQIHGASTGDHDFLS